MFKTNIQFEKIFLLQETVLPKKSFFQMILLQNQEGPLPFLYCMNKKVN